MEFDEAFRNAISLVPTGVWGDVRIYDARGGYLRHNSLADYEGRWSFVTHITEDIHVRPRDLTLEIAEGAIYQLQRVALDQGGSFNHADIEALFDERRYPMLQYIQAADIVSILCAAENDMIMDCQVSGGLRIITNDIRTRQEVRS